MVFDVRFSGKYLQLPVRRRSLRFVEKFSDACATCANSHRFSLDTGPSGGAGAAFVEDAGFVWIHNKVNGMRNSRTIIK
jgi:hypothetical protein